MVIALPDTLGAEYLAGSTVEALALRYGVHPSTIRTRLNAADIPMRRPGPVGGHVLPQRSPDLGPEVVELPQGWHDGPPDWPTEAAVREMVEAYAAGTRVATIANKFAVPVALIEREVGARMPLRGPWKIPVPDAVVGEYLAGASLTRLGDKYEVAPNTVKAWLLAAGVELRAWRVPVPPEAVAEYRAGATVGSLAVKYQVSPHTARRWMVDAGLLSPLQTWSRR